MYLGWLDVLHVVRRRWPAIEQKIEYRHLMLELTLELRIPRIAPVIEPGYRNAARCKHHLTEVGTSGRADHVFGCSSFGAQIYDASVRSPSIW